MRRSDAFIKTLGGFAIAATLFAAPSSALADGVACAEDIRSNESVGAAVQEGAIPQATQPFVQDLSDDSAPSDFDADLEAAADVNAEEGANANAGTKADEDADADVKADEIADADADANTDADVDADADEVDESVGVDEGADVDADDYDNGCGYEYGYGEYTCRGGEGNGSKYGCDRPNWGECPCCANRHNHNALDHDNPDNNTGQESEHVIPTYPIIRDENPEINTDFEPSDCDENDSDIMFICVVCVDPEPDYPECDCYDPSCVDVVFIEDDYDESDYDFDESDYDEYDYGEAVYDDCDFDGADWDECDYDECDFDEGDYDESGYDGTDINQAGYDEAAHDECEDDDDAIYENVDALDQFEDATQNESSDDYESLVFRQSARRDEKSVFLLAS